MKLTTIEAIIATIIIGALMLLLRALPFLIFSNKKPPAFFSFVEKFIPDISIAVLLVTCLKSSTVDLLLKNPSPSTEVLSVVCTVIASLFTALLQIWKKNAMISIFSGTILYMILNYFF